MYHEDLWKKQKNIEKEMKSIQSILKNLPEGKLICAKNGNNYKWYCSDGKNKTYIEKKNRSFAEKLAMKKYYSMRLEDLKQKWHILNSYARLFKESNHKTQKLLMNPGYQELLIPILPHSSNKYMEWMKQSYKKNLAYPEHLTLNSISGNVVRSKSELLIDTFLYNNQIPYRYECALELGSFTIYPDFTIMHPLTGKIYYWEHLGRMNDSIYRKKAYKKLQSYMENNILPMEQLILTYETKEKALDAELIQKIIELYFLC